MARIDEVTIVWKTDTTALDKSKAAFSDIDRNVQSAEKSTTTFTNNANKQLSTLNSTIKTIGATIAAAFAINQIIGFGREILSIGTDFTATMSQVKSLTQATEEEFLILEARARELGDTTQFSATQAAEAMALLAQAGFTTTQIYDALPSVLELAAAGQLDLASSADIAANVLSAYGLQATELAHVNDLIVATTSKANNTVQEYAESFKFVGPIAKAAGVELEEVSAMIGLLANAGIKGSMAGTTLRSSISSLIKPTREAQQELKALGITTTDADGNLRPLGEIFTELGEKGATTGQLFTIFGEQAASGAAVLTKAGGTIKTFGDELENSVGIASRIASEQMDNLKGDTAELESAFEGLILNVFKAAEPILRTLAQAFTAVINNIGSLIKIVLIGTVGFTAYTVATRGLTIALGFTSSVLKAARAAMVAFNTAMASNPIGLIAAGLAAAAAAAFVYRKEISAAVNGQQALTDSQQEFLDMTAKEEGQLKTLFDALRTAAEGSERRKVAIEEINKAYGQYLPNMLTEESTAQDIEDAYKLINDQLINKIALQQREKEITEANTRFIESQRLAYTDLSATQIAAISDFIKANDLLAEGAKLPTFSIIEAEAKKAGLTAGTFTARIITMIDAQKVLNGELANTEAFFSQYADAIKETVNGTEEIVTETLAANDAMETLKKRIEELGKELLLQSLAGKINNATLAEYNKLTTELSQAQYMLKQALEGTNQQLKKVHEVIVDEVTKGTSSAIDQFGYMEEAVKETYNKMLIAAHGNATATALLESNLNLQLLDIQKQRLEFELGLLTEGTLQYQKKRNEILEIERKLQQQLTDTQKQGSEERNRIQGETDRQRDKAEFERLKEAADAEIALRTQVRDASFNLAQELSGALQEISSRRLAYEDKLIQDQLDRGIISEEQAAAKRKELQIEEAQRNKQFAIFDILLNTARAIISALASTPPNPVLAAFSAATGAIQLGIAASTPLPFADGVIDLNGKNKGVDSIHALLAPGESVMTHKETKKYKPALLAMRNGVFDKEYLPLRTVKEEFAVNNRDGGSTLDTAEMEYLLAKVWRANEAGAEKIATAVTKSMNRKQGKRYYL